MTSALTDVQVAALRRLLSAHPMLRVLTVRQPWADLIMAGVPEPKNVENRTWPVPSTLPQWGTCPSHGRVRLDYPPDGHIAEDGPDRGMGMGHAPGCYGDCDRHGCPVPVPVQVDPRYPCGPIEPDGPFPITVGIHAAKQPDTTHPRIDWARLTKVEFGGVTSLAGGRPERYGALLGTVPVTGCHHADECIGGPSCSRWAEPDAWHWTLADPTPLDVPIPMRGQQRLWTAEAGQA